MSLPLTASAIIGWNGSGTQRQYVIPEFSGSRLRNGCFARAPGPIEQYAVLDYAMFCGPFGV